MSKLLFSLIAFSFIFYSCATEKEAPLVELNKEILNIIQTTDGDFAIAFKDLNNGDSLFINANQSFHAASTMKTPVMIELYKQAAEGKFSLDDSIIIKNEFKSIVDGSAYQMSIGDDSEDDLYSKIGSKTTIRDLNYQMITKSSNLATNILIDLVDAAKVNATMREIGATDIEVLRGVEDIKAFDRGLNNTTTAKDLMVIFEALSASAVVSEEACTEMLGVLNEQYFNEIIPAQLPSGVKVAHKTGSITGVQHDSGLITLVDGRRYVLVLLSKNLEDEKEGVKQLAKISKLVYDYVN